MTSETELRDSLAVERTHLANERTLLSYLRTALTMVAAGAGLIHFIGSDLSDIAGWIFILAGGLAFPLGIWRFYRVRAALDARRRGAPHG